MNIAVRNLGKRFGAFLALDNASIDVPSGGLMTLRPRHFRCFNKNEKLAA